MLWGGAHLEPHDLLARQGRVVFDHLPPVRRPDAALGQHEVEVLRIERLWTTTQGGRSAGHAMLGLARLALCAGAWGAGGGAGWCLTTGELSQLR